MPVQLIVTDAGRAEAVTAGGSGLSVEITEIAIGSGQWTPDATATALNSEIKRLPAQGAQKTQPDSVTLQFQDSTADVYTCHEVGFYLSSGTLLAILTDDVNPLVDKGASLNVLWSKTLTLQSLPNGSVTVTPSLNFIPPTGSETVEGVFEVATEAEVDAGADDSRVITPLKLEQRLLKMIPAGTILTWPTSIPPLGFLACDGSELDRTAYSRLFGVIGTIWGNGNGSTTFDLPDHRGVFLRGWDNGRGLDSGRAFASYQADLIGAHSHTIWRGRATTNTSTNGSGFDNPAFDGSSGSSGGSETRPKNNSVLFIIRY